MTTRATDAVAIFYPETDGMPLPDGEFQAPIYRRVVGTLEMEFDDLPDVWVNGNTFIYYVEGDNRISVSPDCYVALNISLESIERYNSYRVWEVGKPPDFVLEIASESTAREDVGRKRDLYAEMEVPEYWMYDETGGDFYGEPLVGLRLVDGEYSRIEMNRESGGRVWSRSDVLGLELWWEGGRLRFRDPISGRWLLTPEEERAGRLEAESRVEEERASRLEAETRLAELEDELRRLRGG